MKEIKKVAIIGAGAVGSYLIWGLSDKLKDDLYVIAQGKRGDRLKEEGLTINGRHFHLHVISPAQAGESGVDLCFLTVKYNALPRALEDLHETCHEDTLIMSLMNGVDSEDRIAERENPENILPSFIKIASHRTGEGTKEEIEFDPPRGGLGIYMGEPDGRLESPRLAALEELFADTPLHYHISEDIFADIWAKYTLNVSENLSQAIVGCGIGAFRDSEHVDALRVLLRDEVIAVALAKGIHVPDSVLEGSKFMADKSLRYSTLQDLDAGRLTEVDMFAGTMMKMGEECGVPTPYCTFTWHIIKALEEKNEGLFDYENRIEQGYQGYVDGRSYKGE